MYKLKKKILCLFIMGTVLICSAVPSLAGTSATESEAFNLSENIQTIYLQNSATDDGQKETPQARIPNAITVQAWEVSPGLIRCTLLNSGIDALDKVYVYVKYIDKYGRSHTTPKRDLGSVGLFPITEDIYIGTGWSYAQGVWQIYDGGDYLEITDNAGE